MHGADSNWNAGDDMPQRCPVVVADVLTTPLGELDQRAQRMYNNAARPPR